MKTSQPPRLLIEGTAMMVKVPIAYLTVSWKC